MTSINTNNAAMQALQTLRTVNSNLQTTQNAVSTGYRVNSAADNAAYWAVATTMRSDTGALGAVSDALGLATAKVDVATTAVQNTIDIVNQIKAKLVSVNEHTTNAKDVQDEISQLQQQLQSVSQSASFSGENWVVASSGATASVVSSFIRSATGGVSVTNTTYVFSSGSAGNVLFGSDSVGNISTSSGILGSTTTIGGTAMSVFSLDVSNLTAGGLASAMNMVQSALDSMTSLGSKLGSLTQRITLQSDFASSLTDALNSGIGKLVDADMEEESSKLTALQTQQQLAVQSLSISNSSTQMILSLFR